MTFEDPSAGDEAASSLQRAMSSGRDIARDAPDLVADSFRLALSQERETVRKAYLEVAELRHRLTDAERRTARLKASLTHKMGEAIVQTRRPKDWFTLAFRLNKAYRSFQKRKAQPQKPQPSTPLPIARRAAALHQALSLIDTRGHESAAQWVRSNVRDLGDRAHVLVNLGFAALPSDLDAASELAAEVERLQPGSARTKALLLSIEALQPAWPT